MSKVKPKRLGDLITLKRGYDLPEKDRIPGPYPVISSAGISGYHNEFQVDGPGVVTGRYGTLGEVYFIDGKYWPHNTALYVQDFKDNDSKYIYYLLSCLGRIRTSDKSAVPGVNRNELHEMAIPAIEDKPTQIKTRKVLEAIDDKIELNNRINAELEAMAKTLYDYWFVQFDFPFDFAQGKPDANGKPYKTSGGKMVYNPTLKREIPEGWCDSTIGKIEPNIITGKTPSTDKTEYFGGEIPFITIGDIRNNTFVVDTEETLTIDGANSQSNKYLPEGTICVTCIASPGLVGFVTQRAQTNQQINSVICSNDYNLYFLYFAINGYFSGAKAKTGNTFANMNKGDFSEIAVLMPPVDTRKLFHTKVNAVFEEIKVRSKENSQLAKLRDWLLPMLMNGQVTVQQ